MRFETKADLEPVSVSGNRQAARDLLAAALTEGQPLRPEVRVELTRLLDTLALSESRSWNPDAFGETADEQRDQPFHGAAWRVLVGRYRELLAEVEANGVTADKAVS